MRSRTARVVSSALACVALGAAAFIIVTTEQTLAQRRATLHAFDLHAREASQLLSDARAGLHAYLATGQSVGFWGPKVGAVIQDASSTIDTLRSLAATDSSRQSLLDTSAGVTELSNIDKRAREYVNSGDTLMASDIVFSDGSEAAADAARAIEATRIGEHQSYDVYEAATRRAEAIYAGGAALFSAIVLLLLTFAPAPRIVAPAVIDAEPIDGLPLRERSPAASTASMASSPASAAVAPAAATTRAAEPDQSESAAAASDAGLDSAVLQSAAELCTAFGRLRDAGELKSLLAKASRLIDATGLVVWIGNASGADLQPVLSHGYSDDVVRRLKAVPRAADNAAAAAYRTGTIQIVNTTADRAPGAIVAPILSADGCIGALSAETAAGAETSESSQALVGIVAAQLANVLAVSAQATAPAARAASA
jgi:hypothetical protein